MKTGECSVLGWGAVTPNGWAMPPGAAGLTLTTERPISGPNEPVRVQRVVETGALWERWKKEPRLRRASPLARYIAQSVDQALAGAVSGRRRGLIGVFFTGALIFSRKFYEGCVKHGRSLASPALFPETVYNSPLSHTAAIMGMDGPVCSLVGDESAWAEACTTAELWLALGTVDEVVVVAAEELDPATIEGIRSAGWLRHPDIYIPAEGACALRLGSPEKEGPRISVAAGGHPFHHLPSCRDAASRVFGHFTAAARVAPTARGLWAEGIERELLRDLPVLNLDDDYAVLGRCFAASGGWAVLHAMGRLGPECPRIHVPLFGSYHAVSALTLAKA